MAEKAESGRLAKIVAASMACRKDGLRRSMSESPKHKAAMGVCFVDEWGAYPLSGKWSLSLKLNDRDGLLKAGANGQKIFKQARKGLVLPKMIEP